MATEGTTGASGSPLQLTGDLGSWELSLKDGTRLTVSAHGYSEEGGTYVFSMLMEGQPCFELDVARIPVAVVDTIYGG